MTDPTNYISLAEAAARLGVSQKTIRRRIADGSITAYRLGTHLIRFDPAELDRVLRPISRLQSPAAPELSEAGPADRASVLREAAELIRAEARFEGVRAQRVISMCAAKLDRAADSTEQAEMAADYRAMVGMPQPPKITEDLVRSMRDLRGGQ